jgi:hypothetical protein
MVITTTGIDLIETMIRAFMEFLKEEPDCRLDYDQLNSVDDPDRLGEIRRVMDQKPGKLKKFLNQFRI